MFYHLIKLQNKPATTSSKITQINQNRVSWDWKLCYKILPGMAWTIKLSQNTRHCSKAKICELQKKKKKKKGEIELTHMSLL